MIVDRNGREIGGRWSKEQKQSYAKEKSAQEESEVLHDAKKVSKFSQGFRDVVKRQLIEAGIKRGLLCGDWLELEHY